MKVLDYVVVFITVVACVFGLKKGLDEARKPICLKFEKRSSDWIIPFIAVYLFIFTSVFFEIVLSKKIIGYLDIEHPFCLLIVRLVDSGIFVVILCGLFSLFFRYLIKLYDLDYSEYYNRNIIRIVCSVSILFIIIALIINAGNLLFEPDRTGYDVFGRIVLWIQVLVGIWWNIDSCSRGRVIREKMIRQRAFDQTGIVELVKYWSVSFCVLIALGIYTLIVSYAPDLADSLMLKTLYVASSFSIGYLFCIIVALIKKDHSQLRSKYELVNNIKKCKNDRQAEGLYCRNRYSLSKEKLSINEYSWPIIYPGHEEEIASLFGEKEYDINIYDTNEIFCILEKLCQDQSDYFYNARHASKREKKEDLLRGWN